MKITYFTPLFAAVLVLLSVSLTAQDQQVIQSEATTQKALITSIEFEETTYDFGTIDEGTLVTRIYTFTNTGDIPLILTNAKGSCGCTVPQWPREPILPGETATLTVNFNSKNKKGKRNQKITITSNTEPAQSYLYMTGNVTPQPQDNNFTPQLAEEATTEEINPDCFIIYPNPTAEILKLKVEKNHIGQSAFISIYSDSGQLMAKREIESIESNTIEFGVGHYPAGTYVANVKIGDQRPETRCFVVVN